MESKLTQSNVKIRMSIAMMDVHLIANLKMDLNVLKMLLQEVLFNHAPQYAVMV